MKAKVFKILFIVILMLFYIMCGCVNAVDERMG